MICAFSDVMNYIAWRHAAPTFTNFDLDSEKFNKYTFYRAIMENTALVTLGHLRLVGEATGNRPEKIVFAGGASQSALWPQILSDVLGIPVEVPVVKEATALGAALLAGKGIGLYPDIKKAARSLVKIEKRFAPDDANQEIYRKAYDAWQTVYASQLRLSDEKTTRHMWSAPGL
jgi:autoinducer 2 (AI-2) kinase